MVYEAKKLLVTQDHKIWLKLPPTREKLLQIKAAYIPNIVHAFSYLLS